MAVFYEVKSTARVVVPHAKHASDGVVPDQEVRIVDVIRAALRL